MMNLTTETGTRASGRIQPIKLKKITFTSTPYTTPRYKYQTMQEQYAYLRTKDLLLEEDLEEFRSLLVGLVPESEWYEEGLFKLRKLQKQYNYKQKEEKSNQENTLEDELINRKLVDFINLGSLGRKWVMTRLDKEEVLALPEEEMVSKVNEKITRLQKHLSTLNEQVDMTNKVQILQQLDITFESERLAEKVVSQLSPADLTKVRTLSDLYKITNTIKNDIEECGMVDSTFEEQTIAQYQQARHPED